MRTVNFETNQKLETKEKAKIIKTIAITQAITQLLPVYYSFDFLFLYILVLMILSECLA